MKPRLRAAWAVSSEQELILASCCLSPMHSVLDELRVKRLTVIHDDICCRAFWRCWTQGRNDIKRRRVEYCQHRGDGLERGMRWEC